MMIDKIKNSTLAKLTADEIQELGLCNEGIGLYRGELKTRCGGMCRKTVDGITFTFDGVACRVEFTRIANDSADDVPHWAARIWNRDTGHYETYPMGIAGCDFIRNR